jgi:hypothetical protein
VDGVGVARASLTAPRRNGTSLRFSERRVFTVEDELSTIIARRTRHSRVSRTCSQHQV